MSSLDTDFNELMEQVRHGREFGHASFEPIFYLVFRPEQILAVKRHLPAWKSRLGNEGWNVHTFSVAEAVNEVLSQARMRKLWLAADQRNPLDWKKTNASLANAVANGALQERLEAKLTELEDTPSSILLVTDLEALHPYMRIGVIEGQLQGRFHVPTVFLYPGVRTGKTRLKFLGFYPEDGNYRSVHVGG